MHSFNLSKECSNFISLFCCLRGVGLYEDLFSTSNKTTMDFDGEEIEGFSLEEPYFDFPLIRI